MSDSNENRWYWSGSCKLAPQSSATISIDLAEGCVDCVSSTVTKSRHDDNHSHDAAISKTVVAIM